MKTTGWGQIWLPAYDVPASNCGSWEHIILDLDTSVPGRVDSVVFKMNGGAWDKPVDGTVQFLVDNIKFTPAANFVVNNFDTDSDIERVFNWWGGNSACSWSPVDAEDNFDSGSLCVEAPLTGPGDAFVCVCSFPALRLVPSDTARTGSDST